jgi:ornithine decarboxylase
MPRWNWIRPRIRSPPESVKHLVARYGSPLLIIDAERVRRQYRRLAAALPGVDLHFALKPLPQAAVIRTLREEGAFFDLATNGEVDLVRRLGIEAERCIHTHPIKRDGDIRTALAYGVSTFVVDNPDELRKFVPFRNRVSLLIRVSFRSPRRSAICRANSAATRRRCAAAGARSAELRIKVAGLSFHAGSQASAPSSTCRPSKSAAN